MNGLINVSLNTFIKKDQAKNRPPLNIVDSDLLKHYTWVLCETLFPIRWVYDPKSGKCVSIGKRSIFFALLPI